jgi:hypothetical protein
MDARPITVRFPARPVVIWSDPDVYGAMCALVRALAPELGNERWVQMLP